MTAQALISGRLCGKRATHPTKRGGEATFFVVAVTMDAGVQFWNCVIFDDDIRAILAPLRDGAPISVAGSFDVRLREWQGKQRLDFRLKADQIVALASSRAQSDEAA
jgi:hypothetical protein